MVYIVAKKSHFIALPTVKISKQGNKPTRLISPNSSFVSSWRTTKSQYTLKPLLLERHFILFPSSSIHARQRSVTFLYFGGINVEEERMDRDVKCMIIAIAWAPPPPQDETNVGSNHDAAHLVTCVVALGITQLVNFPVAVCDVSPTSSSKLF